MTPIDKTALLAALGLSDADPIVASVRDVSIHVDRDGDLVRVTAEGTSIAGTWIRIEADDDLTTIRDPRGVAARHEDLVGAVSAYVDHATRRVEDSLAAAEDRLRDIQALRAELSKKLATRDRP